MESAQELFEDARRRPAAESRPLILRAIAAADAEGDVDLAFTIRMHQVRRSELDPDRISALASYGWCLARHDEDPDRFPVGLWYYKWIVSNAACYPSIDQVQWRELIDDMEQRFTANNLSMAPVMKQRVEMARATTTDRSNPAEFQELFDDWRTMERTSRGRMNDCSACDDSFEADQLRWLGLHDEALELAAPLLNQNRSCTTEPQYAMGQALLSARLLGRLDDANEWSVAALSRIDGRDDFIEYLAPHMIHLAWRGDVEDALSLANDSHMRLAASPEDSFQYHRGVRVALEAARLRNIATPATERLAEACGGVAETIAAQFDARNASTIYTDQLQDDLTHLATAPWYPA